jgi:phosphoribosylanthranilate isomerase
LTAKTAEIAEPDIVLGVLGELCGCLSECVNAMLIKICGITRLEDARVAVECGANAVGFVFWPGSPRWIDPARAQAIAARLPPFVTPVGVFVNQPADDVNSVAAAVGLGVVQLHGDESIEFAAGLNRPVLKAMTLAAPNAAIDRWPAGTMVLLDAHDPVRRGGTGRTIDWTRAASVASRRPIVLAGGLNPDNVADAIARVQPYGIDVSSGVEAAPGVKDHGRLKQLFEAIREAAARQSAQRTQWTREHENQLPRRTRGDS